MKCITTFFKITNLTKLISDRLIANKLWLNLKFAASEILYCAISTNTLCFIIIFEIVLNIFDHFSSLLIDI